MNQARGRTRGPPGRRALSLRWFSILLTMLLHPGLGSAQQITCRALPGGTAAPSLGQTTVWPHLVDDLFLGRLLHADLLSDGSVVVIDRTAPELLRIDRTSGRVSSLARKGQGPGEIGGVAGMVVSAGDIIVVLDRLKQQLMRLNPQGALVSATPFQPLGLPVLLASTGREVIEVSRNRPPGSKVEAITMTVRVFSPDSTRIVRKAELRDLASEPGILTPVGFGALLDSSHLLLASGVTADISVLSLRGTGDSIVHLTIGPPRKLTRELAEHVLTQALPQFPIDERRRMIANILGSNPLVAFYPMFSRLVIGASGSLWVQRTYMSDGGAASTDVPAALSMDDLGGFVWLQFAPNGKPSAECRTPPGWRVLIARRGEVVFTRDDATSTQFITWRLR